MRLQRLLGILAMLLKQGRVRAEDLAERFEVSVRTIHRDIEMLEQAGVPIVTYPGVNGGIEIMDTYKLDKNVFLNEDFVTLLSGLKSISGTLDASVVNRTMAKLEALMSQKQTQQLQTAQNKLYIDLKPWSVHPEFESLFHVIKDGVDQDRLLRIVYAVRDGKAAARIVEPHQLLLKEQNWYLRAFCRERQEFRTFRLQRIREVECLDETFVPRSFPAEPEDFKQWKHPKLITVELLAHPSMRSAMQEFCSPEHFSDGPDGLIHVNLPFVESRMGYGVLLQLGPQCEVIGPDHVRKELKRRICELQKVYG